MTSPPSCWFCGCSANDIIEYRAGAAEANLERKMLGEPLLTPEEWMRKTEPTFDESANKFCCTWCYTVKKMMHEQQGRHL